MDYTAKNINTHDYKEFGDINAVYSKNTEENFNQEIVNRNDNDFLKASLYRLYYLMADLSDEEASTMCELMDNYIEAYVQLMSDDSYNHRDVLMMLVQGLIQAIEIGEEGGDNDEQGGEA